MKNWRVPPPEELRPLLRLARKHGLRAAKIERHAPGYVDAVAPTERYKERTPAQRAVIVEERTRAAISRLVKLHELAPAFMLIALGLADGAPRTPGKRVIKAGWDCFRIQEDAARKLLEDWIDELGTELSELLSSEED